MKQEYSSLTSLESVLNHIIPLYMYHPISAMSILILHSHLRPDIQRCSCCSLYVTYFMYSCYIFLTSQPSSFIPRTSPAKIYSFKSQACVIYRLDCGSPIQLHQFVLKRPEICPSVSIAAQISVNFCRKFNANPSVSRWYNTTNNTDTFIFVPFCKA